MTRGRHAVFAPFALLGIGVGALAGCAPAQSYDSVLWRQIREQQSVTSDILRSATQALTRDELLARLEEVADVWTVGEPPPSPTGIAWTVVHDVQDAGLDDFGDPVLAFTEFVSSGIRADGPREDAGVVGGQTYSGPSVVYTCYIWHVVFVADRVWNARLVDYATDGDLDCDARLIAGLAPDAAHIPTADLLG